jgi:protein tyrosine/serine phosphatase
MTRPLLPDSYWVVPGQVAAGEYPGARFRANTREKLGLLLDAGIRTFIDLTEEDELRPYVGDLEEIAAARGIRVQHVRMSIRDLCVPELTHLQAILDLIDRSSSDGNAVYVHCWGGIGRTGTVIGCWLARNGYAKQAALDRIAELRGTTPSAYRQSPETSEQRDFVLAFEENG